MIIRGDFLVEKQNVLNELRTNSLTLQELRFFSIYLAKINAREPSTRVVRFSVFDFQKIMELGKMSLSNLQNTVDSLLCKIIGVPIDGGVKRFQLFKECIIAQDSYGEWYIEIDAHDSALPLIFDFKEKYFTYELWNALRLKSANQIRMYEILKQYEFVRERILSIDELRELLGIFPNDYSRFNNFKVRVLDACQASLEENTDIKFTYELIGKKGKGGKISAVKFNILKNEGYIDKLSIFEYIGRDEFESNDYEDVEEEDYFAEKVYPVLSEACENEFTLEEVRVFYTYLSQITPKKQGQSPLLLHFGTLKRKYEEMRLSASRRSINNRYGYLKKMLEKETEV